MSKQFLNGLRREWGKHGTLTRIEVAANGVNPDLSNLIHFTDAAGVECYPSFQFDPSGQPYQVVLDVNAELGYERDCSGVTGWWFTEQSNGSERLLPKDMIDVDALWVTDPRAAIIFAANHAAALRTDYN